MSPDNSTQGSRVLSRLGQVRRVEEKKSVIPGSEVPRCNTCRLLDRFQTTPVEIAQGQRQGAGRESTLDFNIELKV